MGTYEDVFRSSTEDPESFWLKAAEGIDWDVAPHRALDSSGAPFYRWFPDGRLNVCFNALDRHIEAGRGEQPALVYDSPVTDTRRTYTYAQLRNEVAAFAGALAQLGVGHGDRVVIYMPMVPEAAVAMLACARIGAVHSVVFGGFAPRELALRIDDAAPKVVVSASCGIEGKRVIAYKPLLDQAMVKVNRSFRSAREGVLWSGTEKSASSRGPLPAVPDSSRLCGDTCHPSTATALATAAPTPLCSTRSGAEPTQPGRRTRTACWSSSTASPPAWRPTPRPQRA